jgi:hypothetical protein
MTLRRRLDWNTAMRDLRKDRAPANPGFLASRAIETAKLDTARRAAMSRPLLTAEGFDRSAIMSAAIASARADRARGSKHSWHQLLASALRFVWARAKATRSRAETTERKSCSGQDVNVSATSERHVNTEGR